jgi:hypothetical protein
LPWQRSSKTAIPTAFKKAKEKIMIASAGS